MGFKSGSGNLGKVGSANQAHHAGQMSGFGKVAGVAGGSGGQRFEHTSAGTPRSAAQQASVKKAASVSAAARGERALGNPKQRASAALTTSPRTPNPALKGTLPGFSTGGVATAKNNQQAPLIKKGLLGL